MISPLLSIPIPRHGTRASSPKFKVLFFISTLEWNIYRYRLEIWDMNHFRFFECDIYSALSKKSTIDCHWYFLYSWWMQHPPFIYLTIFVGLSQSTSHVYMYRRKMEQFLPGWDPIGVQLDVLRVGLEFLDAPLILSMFPLTP